MEVQRVATPRFIGKHRMIGLEVVEGIGGDRPLHTKVAQHQLDFLRPASIVRVSSYERGTTHSA